MMNKKIPNFSRLLVLVSTAFMGLSAAAADFDLVIKNGRVMDPETGFDLVANVGINNGFITAVTTDKIKGARELDAKN